MPFIVAHISVVWIPLQMQQPFSEKNIEDERLREREKGPDGNNYGMFRKRWADHNYYEEGGEPMVLL